MTKTIFYYVQQIFLIYIKTIFQFLFPNNLVLNTILCVNKKILIFMNSYLLTKLFAAFHVLNN